MLSAWLLPEHIADVLPQEARRIEALRRQLLDIGQRYGFELVVPPLLEHLESLLTGTGHALDLRTFKLVDQSSGRMLGLRADTTPQAARIDAHLLNREGVTRLCYCGPVLHTRAAAPGASREPLQFGAEVFGHAGLEADLEVAELALDCVTASGPGRFVIDLADARVLRGVLAGLPVDAQRLQELVQALSEKDAATLAALCDGLPETARAALRVLPDLYGGTEVLQRARELLPQRPLIHAALDELQGLATRLQRVQPSLQVGVDLSDVSGYDYYSGLRFSIYGHGAADALARGGRYDEVGAVFGRNRPAVGFSLDLKVLAERPPQAPPGRAVRAPWSDDPALLDAVRALRRAGHTVVCLPDGPAADDAGGAWVFDRALVADGARWAVCPLAAART